MGSGESVTRRLAIVQSLHIVVTAFCTFGCLVRFGKFVNCSKSGNILDLRSLAGLEAGLGEALPSDSIFFAVSFQHFYRMASCAIMTW